MNQYLINKIENLVKNACYQPSNIFGKNIWDFHIIPVVNHSKKLSKILNVDTECAILSAYLHDYASILNKEYYPEHHIYGAQIATEILTSEDYPEDKVFRVQKSILNHRASITKSDTSADTICLASADAMAHITEVPSLLYLAYHQKNLGINEGKEWVLKKIGKSWNKLCPEAKIIVNDIYEIDKQFLQ